MFASPRRVSRRDVELGVRPTREVRGHRQIRHEQAKLLQAKAFERFIRIYKEGDVVSATVIRSKSKDGEALLECGVKAHIDDCLDHEPGKKACWIAVPAVGQRTQVYVRVIRPANHHVCVSIHTFTQDTHFNLFNVGYRTGFDGTAASFALLPWEKPWLDRGKRRG